MKTILYIMKKEFQQFRRDPKMFMLILVSPLMQLLFLGYAVNFDVNVVHTAVFDGDRTETSRSYIERFSAGDRFKLDYYVDNYDDLQKEIDNGNALVAIVIPRGFEKNIMRNIPAKVQILFEGSDGNSASIAAGYVQEITSEFSKNILLEKTKSSGAGKPYFNLPQTEARVWYNPELLSRNFMVPGIVAMLLMIITLVLTSLAIVKEKEIGTFEQLIVTPIKSYQLILGKIIPFIIIGFVVISIIIPAMRLIFDVAIKGSIFFLFFSSFLFVLSTLGLGMLISTVSKTQQQAMMISIFLVMMPMVFLSGFAFPIENMPKLIQYITYIIPLRYFMIIIRGVIMKGTGFETYLTETVILFLMGTVILIVSSIKFRKRLE